MGSCSIRRRRSKGECRAPDDHHPQGSRTRSFHLRNRRGYSKQKVRVRNCGGENKDTDNDGTFAFANAGDAANDLVCLVIAEKRMLVASRVLYKKTYNFSSAVRSSWAIKGSLTIPASR